MIDLNKIRSVKTLETMKKDCEFVLNDPIFHSLYIDDYGWGEEDLDADREEIKYFLERLELRLKSLERFESKKNFTPSKEKPAKNRQPKPAEPKETGDELSPSQGNGPDSYTEPDTAHLITSLL